MTPLCYRPTPRTPNFQPNPYPHLYLWVAILLLGVFAYGVFVLDCERKALAAFDAAFSEVAR